MLPWSVRGPEPSNLIVEGQKGRHLFVHSVEAHEPRPIGIPDGQTVVYDCSNYLLARDHYQIFRPADRTCEPAFAHRRHPIRSASTAWARSARVRISVAASHRQPGAAAAHAGRAIARRCDSQGDQARRARKLSPAAASRRPPSISRRRREASPDRPSLRRRAQAIRHRDSRRRRLRTAARQLERRTGKSASDGPDWLPSDALSMTTACSTSLTRYFAGVYQMGDV